MSGKSWYYVAPPGEPVKRQAIGIERGGQPWSGSWTIEGDRRDREALSATLGPTMSQPPGRSLVCIVQMHHDTRLPMCMSAR
jgi:hypothetical protein